MPAPKRTAQQLISEHKKHRSEACNLLVCFSNSALKLKAGFSHPACVQSVELITKV